MRRLVFLLPLAVFLGIAFYFVLPLVRGTNPSVIPSALIDRPVPAFNLPPLPGHVMGLADKELSGEVQLVNVFASWCLPCKAEHPLLMRLAREQGVTIRGINYKDKPGDALAWLAAHGNPYKSIGADEAGRVSIDWGVYGVPETYIVDRQGRIRYRHVGPLAPAVVESAILPLLKELRG